jgi:hypothetical protein
MARWTAGRRTRRTASRSGGGVISAGGGTDRRASSRPSADRRPHGGSAYDQGRGSGVSKSAAAIGIDKIFPRRGEGHRLRRGRLSLPKPAGASSSCLRRLRTAGHILGNGYHPHALHVAAMRHPVHGGPAVAEGRRPGPGVGPSLLRLDRLGRRRPASDDGAPSRRSDACPPARHYQSANSW